MMRALDRKLIRDLAAMKTQAVAIAVVVASGVALFIGVVAAYRALAISEARYYEQHRFAHVWVRLARAPASIVREIAALPGVAAVEGRVVSDAILDLPGVDEPATGLLVSIPPRVGHALNDLYIRRGRHVERDRPGEVLVNEPFADENGLRPGDRLHALVAGTRIELRIVGVALSPEHVMQIPPGGIAPDDRRFSVFWMERDQLAGLIGLREAVNDLSIRLAPGGSEASVIAGVDRLLEPYGGHGAFGRAGQMSHVELENHINQLKGLSLVIPAIFLVVAAFLVNVVLGRVVGLQRAQIGMLKAFGYSNARLAGHYLQLAFTIVLAGIVIGLPVGIWLGRLIAEFYGTFFRFPELVFRVEPSVVAIAVLVTAGASLAGVWGTLFAVVAMPPVVAMSSPAPLYRPTSLARSRIFQVMAPAMRMIVRNVSRRPQRAALTAGGMSLALAVLVLGGSSADSLTRMIEVQFHAAQREDVSVVLAHRRSLDTWRDTLALPGVRVAEPYRAVPARVRAGGRTQDVTVLGLLPSSRLRRIVGAGFDEMEPPPEGALINAWLATRFGIHRGDPLAIEVREDDRRVVTTRVVGFVDEPIGSFVYMDLEALGRLLNQPQTFSGVHLLVDPSRQAELYATLKRAPQALGVETRRNALANFRSMVDTSLAFVRQIEVVFAVIIAFGVVYNAARIALAERGHELATLRVLGFRRREISAVLLGEIGLLALLAVPLGFGLGYGLSAWVSAAMSNQRFRMPMVIEPETYAFALVVFVIATIGSALIVRRRLDHLDLVEVLKARE